MRDADAPAGDAAGHVEGDRPGDGAVEGVSAAANGHLSRICHLGVGRGCRLGDGNLGDRRGEWVRLRCAGGTGRQRMQTR
jgi:hypothetical protein